MTRKRKTTGLPRVQRSIETAIETALRGMQEIESILHAMAGQTGALSRETSGDIPDGSLSARLSDCVQQLQAAQQNLRQSKAGCSHEVRALDREIGELESRAHAFQKLYETGLAVTAELDLDRILELGIDAAIDITNARRGYIALVRPEGELDVLVARNIESDDGGETADEISRTIVQKAVRTNAPVEIEDAMQREDLRHMKSVEGFRLRSVICVPFGTDDRVLGVIYLDNKASGGIFTAESAMMLKAFAKQIAVAVRTGIAYRSIHASRETFMESLRERYEFTPIIGRSERLRQVLEMVAKVADTAANVLIQGESGTGKELIAYALHRNSARKDHPFVVVNAAAIPEHLLESELFGFEKGAFTGALASKPGKFELANGGTLFLDEIGDMSVALQAKLLRAVQQRVVDRLGGSKSTSIDIRIIAATNRDIPAMIVDGRFREDLYYRLNVVSVTVPALRDRREDIPLLARHFLERFAAREKKTVASVSPGAMALLEQYDWPGNARQLENTMERAVILCTGDEIDADHLPPEISGGAASPSEATATFTNQLDHFKRILIRNALKASGNNKTEAARQLGLSRSYFYELLSELNLS